MRSHRKGSVHQNPVVEPLLCLYLRRELAALQGVKQGMLMPCTTLMASGHSFPREGSTRKSAGRVDRTLPRRISALTKQVRMWFCNAPVIRMLFPLTPLLTPGIQSNRIYSCLTGRRQSVAIPCGISCRPTERQPISHLKSEPFISSTTRSQPTCLDAGADLAFVRDWLGHANIQNTLVYARVTTVKRDTEARRLFASPWVV